GFAVHLCYLRFPGRVLRADETPPADMLAFIAAQIGCDAVEFASYARRNETRWEHLGELQTFLNVRPFRREDARAVARAGIDEATGSDRGDAIVSAMIAYLREQNILLPSSSELERLAPAARAVARKRAYRHLMDGLSPETIAGLEALLVVTDDEDRTPLAWLREWPEAPRQRNLVSLVERMQAVRKLGVVADREKRIHRARYAAIARELAILVPRDIRRLDTAAPPGDTGGVGARNGGHSHRRRARHVRQDAGRCLPARGSRAQRQRGRSSQDARRLGASVARHGQGHARRQGERRRPGRRCRADDRRGTVESPDFRGRSGCR